MKAKELVNKFKFINGGGIEEMPLSFGKKCAIIAIDFAIQNNRKLLDSQLNNDFDILSNINELTEIKQEIQKL